VFKFKILGKLTQLIKSNSKDLITFTKLNKVKTNIELIILKLDIKVSPVVITITG